MQARSRVLSVAALPALVALAACDGAGGGRADFLASALWQDSYAWLDREPQLVEQKFAKMASSLFAMLRGTVAIFASDWQSEAAGQRADPFTGKQGGRILLTGDPHLENLAVYVRDPARPQFAFADLDAATWGPWSFDVRRLALSCAALAEGNPAVADGQRQQWASSAGEAYAAEVALARTGQPPSDVVGMPATILADLLARASADVAASKASGELRDPANPARFRRGAIDEPAAGYMAFELVDLQFDAQQALALALAVWQPALPSDPRLGDLTDAVRRLGQGVASYPVWRFYVALRQAQGPTKLVEFKEAADVPRSLGVLAGEAPLAEDNGRRVALATRLLQPYPDIDPANGWAQVGQLSFRTRTIGDFSVGLSSARIDDKLAKGKWSATDVSDLCRQAGQTLAQTHLRGRTPQGKPALVVLGPGVPAAAALGQEVAQRAGEMLPALQHDLQLLRAMRAVRGPLLGLPTRSGP
jgi:hypothetical protein